MTCGQIPVSSWGVVDLPNCDTEDMLSLLEQVVLARFIFNSALAHLESARHQTVVSLVAFHATMNSFLAALICHLIFATRLQIEGPTDSIPGGISLLEATKFLRAH